MKRIFLFVLLASLSLPMMAQTDELKVKTSGRALFDEATYFDTDNVDMNNGISVADIRIGMKAYYGNWYLRSEVSYKQQKISLKDFYLQYNFKKNNYLRLGHYTVPFGLQSATGSADKEFLSDPEANIYQPGRRIGLMHTYYKNRIWLQYGVFADESALKKSTDESGPQGYTLATRFVVKPLIRDTYALHLGLSGLYRKADATQDGKANALTYAKTWMTTVDKRKAIGMPVLADHGEWTGRVNALTISDAKWEFKYTPEVTGYFRNFAFAAQYFGSMIRRDQMDNSVGDPDFRSSGYYVTLRGIILNPSNYHYNESSACVAPPTDRNLELVLGYCVADFNDSKARNLDLNKAMEKPGFAPVVGIAGGRFMSFNTGLSFYWNKYVTLRAEYDYMTVSRPDMAKQKVNAIQFRAQYKF